MPDAGSTNGMLQWWATLGVGGVLASMMFIFYRKDMKQYTELWRQQTDVLVLLVRENTQSNDKLVAAIGGLQARLDRLPATACILSRPGDRELTPEEREQEERVRDRFYRERGR